MNDKFKALAIDVTGVTGLGSLAYGIWQIYQPAAFIVVGILMLVYAVRAA